MPVNDRILYTDYNTLRDAIADILGTGSGWTGYGQNVQSSRVSGASGTGPVLGGGSGANSIRTDEYSKLRYDIINVYRHIYGTDPTPADPQIGQLIRYVTAAGATTAEYNVSEYGIAEYNATSIAGSSDPYTQFQVFVSDLTTARFTCATSQSITESKGSVARVSSWGGGNTSIGCRISVSSSSADQARHFFNSGGEIRIASQRGGGAASSQNTAWSNLLAAAGTRTFGAQLPLSGNGGVNATNFYQLGNTYLSWYSVNASTPYGSNQYRIAARTLNGAVSNNNNGGALGVDFLVSFQDSYTDPSPGNPPSPEDIVDGTLQIAVTLKRATGNLVPEPATGSFTIESPTVGFFGAGTGNSNVID